MKFHQSSFWIALFLITGIGLVTTFEWQTSNLLKNQSTQRCDFNPFALTKMEAIKKSSPSIRVYFAAIENTKNSNISTKEFLKVAHEESGYKDLNQKNYTSLQTSSANALGTWQVRIPTARMVLGKEASHMSDKQLRQKLLTDIEFNAKVAMKYLEMMHKRYKGDKSLVFASYNRGPGRVRDHSDVNQYSKNITN